MAAVVTAVVAAIIPGVAIAFSKGIRMLQMGTVLTDTSKMCQIENRPHCHIRVRLRTIPTVTSGSD